MWHELHKENNRLRHLDTTLPFPKSNEFTYPFRNTGHLLNLTSTHRSEIGKYNIMAIDNKQWHQSGVPFSKLPRWRKSKSTPNLYANMTIKEALGMTDDPLQNKFVSNHTKHNHDGRAQQKLDALHLEQNKENIPSSAFAGPPRPELFDLDKVEKENKFDKIDTESIIFTQNSEYWLRDNAGFSMRNSVKQSLENSVRNINRRKLSKSRSKVSKMKRLSTSKSSNATAVTGTTRLPKISQKTLNHRNGPNPKSPINHHIDGHTVSAPGLSVDHRRLVGSQSLNKLYEELEFKKLSSILSSKKVGIHSNFPLEPLTALSTPSCGSVNSAERSARTGESTVMHSPLLDIKLHPRTPINHKQLKKYLYKNIFDTSRPNNKIYVLGSNSIQGPPPATAAF